MVGVRVLALGGTLDADSSCLRALQIALTGAAQAGAEVELLRLHELALPLYVHGTTPPEGALRLVEAVRRADGLVWASPLYHGTVSGAFKNALDWLELLAKDPRPYLSDKPVGLICTAGGAQGMQAINTMEFAVRSLRGLTVPLVAPVAKAWQAFDADGEATDPEVGALLRRVGGEVARLALRLKAAGGLSP